MTRFNWWVAGCSRVCRRVPDGEPGDRANWVLTQSGHFLDNPKLDVVVHGRARVLPGHPRSLRPARLSHGGRLLVPPHSVKARRGRVPLAEGSRFLVSIPTPFNAVNSFAHFDSQVEIAYAHEQRLRDSVDALQDLIPP